jgi:hypothetical protein
VAQATADFWKKHPPPGTKPVADLSICQGVEAELDRRPVQTTPFAAACHARQIVVGDLHYALGVAYLHKHPHDLCRVTDGDADPIGGMDGRGHPLSTHQLIGPLLRHFIVNRKGRKRRCSPRPGKPPKTMDLSGPACRKAGAGTWRHRGC